MNITDILDFIIGIIPFILPPFFTEDGFDHLPSSSQISPLRMKMAMSEVRLSNEPAIHRMVAELRSQYDDAAIEQCYQGSYAGHDVNLFRPHQTAKYVIQKYLTVHSERSGTLLTERDVSRRAETLAENLEHLLNSVKDCLQKPESERYQRGLTSLSFLSYDEYSKRLNPKLGQRSENVSCVKSCNRVRHNGGNENISLPAKWDWRKQNAVTPVKDQGGCGSCAIFAAIGAVEGAYLIKTNAEPDKAMFSEQAALNCLQIPYICENGLPADMPFEFSKYIGVASQNAVPYTGKQTECGQYDYLFKISDYCLEHQLTNDEIKRYLMANGPAAIGIDASHKDFTMVTDVYNGHCGKKTNHAVTLIGWDEKHWIIKNSWGTGWGKNGYFRLPHRKNKCGYRDSFLQAFV